MREMGSKKHQQQQLQQKTTSTGICEMGSQKHQQQLQQKQPQLGYVEWMAKTSTTTATTTMELAS